MTPRAIATLDFLWRYAKRRRRPAPTREFRIADVLSTFTGLLTLADLGGLDEVDLSAARSYVESMELPAAASVAAIWDERSDVEYTFYGLVAVALLANAD